MATNGFVVFGGQAVPVSNSLSIAFDVTTFGAAGNGVSDDTAAVNLAAAAVTSAGGGFLHFPATTSFYKLSSAISIPSNTTVLVEGTVSQTSVGKHLFTATGQSNIKVSGSGKLQGLGGATFLSTEHALFFTNCQFVSIDSGLDINTFAGHGIYLVGCSDVQIGAVTIYNIAGGVRLQGNTRVSIVGATLRDPSTAPSTFTGGFFLDSTDGNTYPPNSDVTFVGCRCKGYINAQSFEAHAGVRVNYVGCTAENSNIGFSINPYSPAATGYCVLSSGFTMPPVGQSVTIGFGTGAGPTVGQYVIAANGVLSGTISAAFGSTSVTFSNSQSLAAGTLLNINGVVYTLASMVSSSTTGTLVTPYSSSTASGLSVTTYGGYMQATAVGGGNITLLNVGDEYNAAAGATVASGAYILPGDIARNINYTGCSYQGQSTTTAYSDLVQHGFFAGGDPNNPVRNVSITGGTVDNAGYGSADIPGAGVYTTNAQKVTLTGVTFDNCWGSAVYLDSGTLDLDASAFNVSNVQTVLGYAAGVFVAAPGITGHVHDFTVDTAIYGVEFYSSANPLSPWLSIDRFSSIGCSSGRAGAPQFGVVDGVLYKPTNSTTVTLSPYVSTVRLNDNTATTITQPMGGAFNGQEIVFQDISGNSTINRATAYLSGETVWSGAVPPSLSGTANVVTGSANVMFSTVQTLAANSPIVFSVQQQKVYRILNSISANTAAQLTETFSGQSNLTSSMVGYQVGTGVLRLKYSSDLGAAVELFRNVSG
jgi:hypothetical protein